MAGTYTYDDFLTAAQNAGMLNAFSPEDLTITQKNPEFGLSMLKLQQDAGKATTSEQKLLAQEAVNQLRKTYNALPTTTAASAETTAASAPATSATADGTASSAVPQTRGYTYSGQNAYQKALENVTGHNPYSYDYKQDPTYAGMRDQYLADNQAMEDKTLSNPAVSSGALPSYAGAAAGQSGNYYAGKLNDIIPQLEQDAYERYLKDFQIANSQLEAAAGDKAFDYSQWQKQQELEMAAIQQEYANDLVRHELFGQKAPALPDLSKVGTGTSVPQQGAGSAEQSGTAVAGTTSPAGEPSGTGAMVPAYSYGQQNAYQEALDAVLNNPAFSYAIQNDPQYASLRKSYLREGQRANEDTLARASAGSMGIPSSYAIRQAVDAGNNFNEQLMGAVPGLQENAYGRYLMDFQNRVGTLGQLNQDRETDYNQWLQNYQLEQKIQQQNFDNALSLYKATGKLTPEIAAALGVPYVAPSVSSGSSYGSPRYNPATATHDDMVHEVNAKRNEAAAKGRSPRATNDMVNMLAGTWYQLHGKYA